MYNHILVYSVYISKLSYSVRYIFIKFSKMTWCLIVYISTFSRHETGFVLLIFALTAALNLCNAYLKCELDYISIYNRHITKNVGLYLHTNINTITAKPKDQKCITQNLLDRFQDSIPAMEFYKKFFRHNTEILQYLCTWSNPTFPREIP